MILDVLYHFWPWELHPDSNPGRQIGKRTRYQLGIGQAACPTTTSALVLISNVFYFYKFYETRADNIGLVISNRNVTQAALGFHSISPLDFCIATAFRHMTYSLFLNLLLLWFEYDINPAVNFTLLEVEVGGQSHCLWHCFARSTLYNRPRPRKWYQVILGPRNKRSPG